MAWAVITMIRGLAFALQCHHTAPESAAKSQTLRHSDSTYFAATVSYTSFPELRSAHTPLSSERRMTDV